MRSRRSSAIAGHPRASASAASPGTRGRYFRQAERRAARRAPLLGRAGRNREAEDASTTGGGLGPDPPSVTLDDSAAGGEADPAALLHATTALEHLEDLGALRQTDAVVAYREGP